MNTSKLKRFATEARTKLRNGVIAKLRSLGVDPADNDKAKIAVLPRRVSGGAMWGDKNCSVEFCDAFLSLDENIKRYGYRHVVEEAAYTWFNRFMAIRILAMNQLCEPVLRFVGEAKTPVIVDEARQGKIPEMKPEKLQELEDLLDDDTKTTEQFAILITAFCWNTPLLRLCFGSVRYQSCQREQSETCFDSAESCRLTRDSDYTNILVPKDILSEGGFIDMMNSTDFINEEDYKSSELLGWLYQFYISERKDEVFAKKGKYETDDIAPATQIFTPNWIVKYMVQNAIGGVLGGKEALPEDQRKYYVDTPESPKAIVFDIEDLKVADFACGSGHILNECFDLLYELYINEGYSRKEAIENIFNKNLLGIDIDTRAKQLATFSLALKACQKDSSLIDGSLLPQIIDLSFAHHQIKTKSETGDAAVGKELDKAYETLKDSSVLGSIMKFDISRTTRLYMEEHLELGLSVPEYDALLALTDHYDAIIMNPPYMPTNRIDDLSKYVNKHYKEGKADLFAVFMQVGMDRLKDGGRLGMINMQSWMFLSSYESLRKLFLKEYTISSMLHLGPRTFDELSGEVVQNTCFIVSKKTPIFETAGTYYRLVDGSNCIDKENLFLTTQVLPSKGNYRFDIISQSNFNNIPGSSLGYWISDKLIKAFETCHTAEYYSFITSGLSTGDNLRFVRLWHEIDFSLLSFKYKVDINQKRIRYVPYGRVGGTRRWYGLRTEVVVWENNGQEIRDAGSGTFRNPSTYFKEGLTWSGISSKLVTFREVPAGSIYDSNQSPLIAFKALDLNYLLGFLNTKITEILLNLINPTFHVQVGDVCKLPVYTTSGNEICRISSIVKDCVEISKQDWDAHEISWNFQGNEIVGMTLQECCTIIEQRYHEQGMTVSYSRPNIESLEYRLDIFKQKWERLFVKLHANEEELNRRFIDIYGLQEELSPHVEYEDITILQQGEIWLYRPTHGVDFYESEEDAEKYGTVLKDEGIVVADQSRIFWNDSVLIKQLLSYAIGCMMGRYRLDRPGLAIAHPNETPSEIAEYTIPYSHEKFWIDDDGIIPLMPEDCGFHDNAANRLATFVRQVFGEDSQVQNLNFIEQCLGKSIEQYFIKDFWKDHKKMYQNRPIYWLFASKNGAFQVLVYVHRMNVATVERIRSRYLLPYIERLNKRIEELEANEASLSTKESKRLAELRKQVDECTEYHNRLAVVAEKGIVPNLDDGIVANHAKYGDVVAKLK